MQELKRLKLLHSPSFGYIPVSEIKILNTGIVFVKNNTDYSYNWTQFKTAKVKKSSRAAGYIYSWAKTEKIEIILETSDQKLWVIDPSEYSQGKIFVKVIKEHLDLKTENYTNSFRLFMDTKTAKVKVLSVAVSFFVILFLIPKYFVSLYLLACILLVFVTAVFNNQNSIKK